MLTKKKLESMEVKAFIDYLVEKKLTKGYFVNSYGNITTSSTLFEEFSGFVADLPDYDIHDGVFFQVDLETKSLFIASIHRTIRGNAQGGTRLKKYHLVKDIFTDALRLAKGMTEKISFAELWWGGGKSIIHPYNPISELNEETRKTILKNFGKFIASLNGLYVCAADMNTSSKDMEYIHTFNRHTTCTPENIGGSANPGRFTAKGVFNGILAGLHFLENSSSPSSSKIDLTGRHIAIQGAGSVGFEVLNQVIKAGGKVTIAEPNFDTCALIKKKFSNHDVTILGKDKLEDIYSVEADVFSPNAIGATINPETIKKLKVKLIAGGANNQLQDASENATALHKKGILYIPDFVINRMGIINCANEQYGYLRSEIHEETDKVYDSIFELLKKSKKENISPYFTAIKKADSLSKKPNPLFKEHRGKLLIQDLINRGWANN